MDFTNELNTFTNPDIRKFAEVIIAELPSYFWEIPASSTGKYHPAQDQLEHGLVYHTIADFKMLNYLCEPAFMTEGAHGLTPRELDLMRAAILVHDGWKSGEVKPDGTHGKYTAFDHPLIAANHILAHKNDGIIPPEEVQAMADAVASHMGQWNTSKYSFVILPLPQTRMQKLVHLADYLASRADVITKEDDYYSVVLR